MLYSMLHVLERKVVGAASAVLPRVRLGGGDSELENSLALNSTRPCSEEGRACGGPTLYSSTDRSGELAGWVKTKYQVCDCNGRFPLKQNV